MKLVGRLFEITPTEGTSYLVTIKCGSFHTQQRKFVATKTMANLIITRHNESLELEPRLDLEFELDGVDVVEVNLFV